MNMSPREDVSSRSIPAAMHLCVNFCYCSMRFCVIFESPQNKKQKGASSHDKYNTRYEISSIPNEIR